MQQLDEHDIEGVHPLYQHLLRQRETAVQQHNMTATRQQQPDGQRGQNGGSGSGEGNGAPSPKPPVSPVAEALEHTSCRRRHRCAAALRLEALMRCQAAREALLALPPEAAFAVLRNYMAAATAKDCSVMIALRPLPPEGSGSGGGRGSSGLACDAMGSVAVGGQHFEYKVRDAVPSVSAHGGSRQFGVRCAQGFASAV